MSKTTGAGIGLALVFIILKCIYFLTDMHYNHYNIVVLTNIVCVLLAVGLAMYVTRDKNNQILRAGIERIKAGMRGGAIYAIIVSTFVFFYYNNIDVKFRTTMIKARVDYAESMKPKYAELQKNNPQKLANKQHWEFVQMEKEQAELWFSPFMICTLTLVSLMVISMLYAVVLSFIFKNYFFRPKF